MMSARYQYNGRLIGARQLPVKRGFIVAWRSGAEAIRRVYPKLLPAFRAAEECQKHLDGWGLKKGS